jgi:hypothetical protein
MIYLCPFPGKGHPVSHTIKRPVVEVGVEGGAFLSTTLLRISLFASLSLSVLQSETKT